MSKYKIVTLVDSTKFKNGFIKVKATHSSRTYGAIIRFVFSP